MQFTVKVKPHGSRTAAALVRECLRGMDTDVRVEEVFPGVESGRRAGLVVVTLSDGVSPEDAAALVETLRARDEVEYVEAAAPRKAR